VPKADGDKFIGTTLPAGYHIMELIGVGGMGRVYQAEQSVLGRTVAVKIIHPHLLSDENSAVRFLTEARAASQLNHPNSISVFDFGRTDDGQPYLVMELLRGKDLGIVAHEEGELPLPRIVDVLRQVLAALGEAHALGIIHRDLKPENIVLQPQRRGGDLVKVLDFGLAKLRADNQSTSVTSPGIVCGTPDYMAPEQGRGDSIDGRSDLYAVGVILFQLLTGRLPFEGESPTQVVMMHLSVPAPDPRQTAPRRNIPAAIAEVVKKALAKKPGDRYADAHVFSDALEDALEDVGHTTDKRDTSTGAAPSLIAGETLECEACSYQVPRARFCCECAAPLPQDRSAQFPAPFTGRAEELSWLESRRPAGAEVAGARLVGEAGSGKSRLLEEFSQSVSAQGDQVILVEPDPHGARVAHFAVGEAIRILARLTPEQIETQDFQRASQEVKKGLNDILRGGTRGDIRSPMERRHSAAAALRWAIVEAAARGPGMPVVILDDMERMDGPSLHAFADVLGDPPTVAALFVGAHNNGFESGWGASRTAARMLGGLEAQAVRSLLPAGTSLPASGSVLPLYLDQALRYHFEGGTHTPERMGDLIHQRLDTLDADARRVLQGLAVIGFSSVISDVAELVQIDGIEDAINLLLARGMITVAGGRAAVSHPLLRHVTLSAIPMEARRQLHKRALRIEDRKRGPLEARAAHAFACQESFQALLLLEQVADRATSMGDTEAEVLALRQGLEVARREISRGEIDDPMRAVLIFSRKLGASLTRAGDFSDADGILRESLDLAGPTSPDRAKILGALAHVSYGRKRYDEALARLEQAISAAKAAKAESLELTLEETKSAWTR
jgi:serine/threonine-protein kinase